MERRKGADLCRLPRRSRNQDRQAWPPAARSRTARIPKPRCPRAAGGGEDLENRRIVAVPGEHRGRASVWAPSLGKLAQLLLAWLLRQAHQSADLDQDGKVAGGEDVAPALSEEQIDFGGPAPDTLDLGQQRNRLLVVLGQIVEVGLGRED